MPSRNTRGRVPVPVQSKENHETHSRPSTASGNSTQEQTPLQPASVPFSQPDPSDTQHHFPYGSAENAVYEASLQLRNPDGFPPNPSDQYQLNMANGPSSRASTSGPLGLSVSQSREASQQLPPFPQANQGEPSNALAYAPGTDASYATNHYPPGDNIDPSLQTDQSGNPQPILQRFHSDQFSRHGTPNDFGATFPGFSASHGVETDGQKKKGASSSATNDKELRELLTANDGRSLKDVATEVLKTERTPKAEKTKQLFAMLWCVSLSGYLELDLSLTANFQAESDMQKRQDICTAKSCILILCRSMCD